MLILITLFFASGLACAQNSFNPDISVSAINAAAWHSDNEPLLPGGHDISSKGFQLQNAEFILSKAVDPYFDSRMNLNLGLAGGETYIELEELWVRTLPLAGATIKAGQFFTGFGRFNSQHPHSWRFTSQALPVSTLLGSEGLRGLGMEVDYLVPVGLYWNLKGSLQQADAMPTFRGKAHDHDHTGRNEEESIHEGEFPAYEVNGLEDLVVSLRSEASFDLTQSASILLGGSYAVGPNAFEEGGGYGTTYLTGLDFFYRWQPVSARLGFPFLAWQTEIIGRFQFAGEVAEDWGLSSEAAWGFATRWSTGIRGEWLAPFHENDHDHAHGEEDHVQPEPVEEAWRAATNLTFYPSEFSSLRLEYSAGAHHSEETIHSIMLQLGVSLGAHGAHQF